mmetsp:Transcript_20397/g.36833  ORF Transcript_20397/g.36833 Transcript_20397/m.36833 type:complete len:165 (+) Transcript_20397:255-749(+)
MQGLQGGEQIEKTRNISDEYTSVSSHPRRLHIERRPALGHTLVEMSCYMLSKTRMACLVGCLKVLILKSNQLSLKLLFLISSTASSMQMETPPKWREIQFWLTEIHVATDFSRSRYPIERMGLWWIFISSMNDLRGSSKIEAVYDMGSNLYMLWCQMVSHIFLP